MKNIKIVLCTIIAVIGIELAIIYALDVHFYTAQQPSYPSYTPAANETKIHLYGEAHGLRSFYKKEYKMWKGYYDRGLRHLFIEDSYFAAQFLNIWMHERATSYYCNVTRKQKVHKAMCMLTLHFYEKLKKIVLKQYFTGLI